MDQSEIDPDNQLSKEELAEIQRQANQEANQEAGLDSTGEIESQLTSQNNKTTLTKPVQLQNHNSTTLASQLVNKLKNATLP